MGGVSSSRPTACSPPPWVPRLAWAALTTPRFKHQGFKHTQILVAQKVAAGVYKGVTTSELDELAAETAAALTSTHPDYAIVGRRRARCRAFLEPASPCSHPRCAAQLAARIAVSNLHKSTMKSFVET